MGKQMIIYKHNITNNITTTTRNYQDQARLNCDQAFTSQNCIIRHQRMLEEAEIELLCPHCEAGFAEQAELINHVTKMHPIAVGIVENCDIIRMDGRKPAYITHTMESLKSSQNKLVSPQTHQIRNFPITSSKSENYVSTTTKSEGSKEARFQCGYCDKSFATPSKVKRHILTHTGEKPFVCQFCQRGFSQKVHMMEHISKHHADESLKAQQEAAANAAAQAAVAQAAAPAPLIKTIVSSSNKSSVYATHTISPSNMVGGQVIHSSQASPIRLANTTITATQVMADSTAVAIPENSYIVAEFSLKTEPHILSSQIDQVTEITQAADSEQHEDTKPTEIMATLPLSQHNSLNYPSLPRSPVSPASFLITQQSATVSGSTTSFQLSSPSISQGTVTQSNERPFVCPHCSADFIRQSNLSVHMMKVHGETVEVRTHQCSYCDKKFKYPNKRRLHEMTHTGEKPNVCQFCTMGFFKKSRLRVHLTKHHGIPEEEVNNPNSTYLQNPTSQNTGTATTNSTLTTTQSLIQKTIAQIQNGNLVGAENDLFCQYCQKPFNNKNDLLAHERQEAMEFEQLHEMFEDTEFTGLGVGSGSQTDIIQNALLTAGIENGLGSPSVTDSDSVVTISEADIDSFSIGFIPDANWSNEVVSTTLPISSSSSSDPFYQTGQPLDLNIKTEPVNDQSQTGESGPGHDLTGTIYTTSETFQNIKTELPGTTLPNLTAGDVVNTMWDTTVALSSLPVSCISTSLNSIKTEPLLSSSSTSDIFTTTSGGHSLNNGIYTETFTIPASLGGPTQDNNLTTSIISLAPGGSGGHQAQIINGNDLDFSKLTGSPGSTTHMNFSMHGQQGFMQDHHENGDGTMGQVSTTHTFSVGLGTSIWADDPTLPAGWKHRQNYREGNKLDSFYMAPDGTQFRSKWKVVEFMEQAGTYCQEEIDLVKSSAMTPQQTVVTVVAVQPTTSPVRERSDKGKREWKEDDPTVPAGWKVAWTTTSDNRSKIAFMSPDKKIFHSRKSALQHMMTEGTYDPADIVKMTKGLNVLLNVGDEWKEGDKSLPEGWKIRSHQWWCQKRNSHRIHYEFLSPLNEFFKSRKAVVEHMTQSGAYTDGQIDLVRMQTTIVHTPKAPKKTTIGVNNNSSGERTITTSIAGGGPTRADLSPSNPLIGWKTGNATLPPNWKIKRHEYANQTVYFYMSPKGEIIKSRRAVIDYMFEDGGYTEEDYKFVISGAKQRKVALQELYDTRMNKKRKKRKRMESGQGNEEFESTQSDDGNDSDEDEEEIKRISKKQKVEKEKEPIQPTRRSGRIKIRAELRDLEDDEEEEDTDFESGDSDTETMTHYGTNKHNIFSSQSNVPDSSGVGDVKRKRGRPPKQQPQLKEDKFPIIKDMMLNVVSKEEIKEETKEYSIEKQNSEMLTKRTDLFMKMSSDVANEIKLEKIFNNFKNEDQNQQDSIHDVNESEFPVDGVNHFSVISNLDSAQIYNNFLGGGSVTPNSSHSVVVNVLNDIVSSVSE